jgi:hypothetical protein
MGRGDAIAESAAVAIARSAVDAIAVDISIESAACAIAELAAVAIAGPAADAIAVDGSIMRVAISES